MAIALTPSQLKTICPDAPASAVLPLNSVLAHNPEVTAWFWNTHHLHVFSDEGDVDGCTRAIAGAEATPERLALTQALYDRACGVLSGGHCLAA